MHDFNSRIRLECTNCGKLLGLAARYFKGPLFIKCCRCGHEIMFIRYGEAVTLKTF